MTEQSKLPILLVVEDDEGLQRQLKWAYDGYDVVVAGDREAALDWYRDHLGVETGGTYTIEYTMINKAFDLPEGTVYPALHRLEQGGLLSSAWTTPPNGRRRRVYSLTKAGSSALGERRKAWGRFSQAVDTALGGGRA